uniref:ATP-dependent DNA helicase n=1 Tax=Panagrellus redivivus TaxID=6233 RepID=A0A7E4VDM8_PANRE
MKVKKVLVLACDAAYVFEYRHSVPIKKVAINWDTMELSDVVDAVSKAVPRKSVVAAYTLPFLTHYAIQVQLWDVLQIIGYENIGVINSVSYFLTHVISKARIPKLEDLRDTIHIINSDPAFKIFGTSFVVKRTPRGYDVVNTKTSCPPLTDMLHILVVEDEANDDPRLRSPYADLFPKHFPMHLEGFSTDFMSKYAWNKYDCGIFDNFLVSETAGIIFQIRWNDSVEEFNLMEEPIPLQRTTDCHIGEARFIVTSLSHGDLSETVNITHRCDFEGVKDRTIRVTLVYNQEPNYDVVFEDVSEIRECPSVKRLSPEDLVNEPLLAWHQEYSLQPLFRNTVVAFNGQTFKDRNDFVKNAAKLCPIDRTQWFVDLYDQTTSLDERYSRRIMFKLVKDIPVRSMNRQCFIFSLTFAAYDIEVPNGHTMAFWSLQQCWIFVKFEDGFRLIGCARDAMRAVQDFDANIVVIGLDFPIKYPVMVAAAREYLAPRDVFVVGFPSINTPQFVPYAWTLVDRTFGQFHVHDFISLKFIVACTKQRMTFTVDWVTMPHVVTIEMDTFSPSALEITYALYGYFLNKKPINKVVGPFKSTLLSITFTIEDAYNINFAVKEINEKRPAHNVMQIVLIEKVDKGFLRKIYYRDTVTPIDTRTFKNLRVALRTVPNHFMTACFIKVIKLTLAGRKSFLAVAKSFNFESVHAINDDTHLLHTSLQSAIHSIVDGEMMLLTSEVKRSDNPDLFYQGFVFKRVCGVFKMLESGYIAPKSICSTYPCVRRIFVVGPKHVIPGLEDFDVVFVPPMFPNCFDHVDRANPPLIAEHVGTNFVAEWKSHTQRFMTMYETVPFTKKVVINIGQSLHLIFKMISPYRPRFDTLAKFIFAASDEDRYAVATITVDKDLIPEIKLAGKPNIVPKIVMEFTEDNLVLIKSKKPYSGCARFPAYISFDSLTECSIGNRAFADFENGKSQVVYDIVKMLNKNYNTDEPATSSKFMVSRDEHGYVKVNAGYGYVGIYSLFGYLLKYMIAEVRQHSKEPLKDIGIKLPVDSTVSDGIREELDTLLKVKLVIFT